RHHSVRGDRRRSADLDGPMDRGVPSHADAALRDVRVRLPRGQLRPAQRAQRGARCGRGRRAMSRTGSVRHRGERAGNGGRWRARAAALLAAASALAGLGAQSVAPAMPLWTVSEGMDSPESVYWDPRSGFVFVSQIVGQAADRDGNGRISKLTLDGRLVAADWVKGLNAPKGLRSHEGTLYAADLDEVVGIDIATGRISSRVKIPGAQFLNDLATAPDGTIYTSDSFGNR